MTKNIFVCHNLRYGIPLNSAVVDFYYSSHMIGFSFPQKKSEKILSEIYRTLKPGGKVRLSLVDGDVFWKCRTKTKAKPKHNSDDNCFSFSQINELLYKNGFVNIERLSYRFGTVPDIETLDDYSPEIDIKNSSATTYVEATKN